ncbi:MAG: tyrosine-specific transport protein [Gammaproteobacteria bacterium]|nr:tyrosine-specific transport protein [Gammaproteobacteria bacterium]
MNRGKIAGSVLIVIGTCIGGGILALPMLSAASGILMSSILLIGIWLLMTLTALLVLEVNLYCPNESNSFGAMAYKTLGKTGQIITWITWLLLLYALLAAYTSGATVLLKNLFFTAGNINLPMWLTAALFICTLGGMVFWSTKAVDHTNRFLMTFKGLLLVSSIALLLPYINLSDTLFNQDIYHNKYLGIAAPIFLFSFGFHIVIPSLRSYIGDKRKELRLIILCGSSIPLIIYLLWLLATLGTVPLDGATNSFDAIKQNGDSIDGLINAISSIINNKWVTASITGFSNISVTTSFLGVSLSLFDFLADGCKRANTRFGRLQTALITFIPPLIFTLYYPKGFIMALEYAAFFVAILLVILPAMMAYKLRQEKDLLAANKILFNKFLLIGIILAGVVLMILQIISGIIFS